MHLEKEGKPFHITDYALFGVGGDKKRGEDSTLTSQRQRFMVMTVGQGVIKAVKP